MHAMSSASSGMFLLVLAGIMNASFSLPMKFARRWAWENTWLAWSIFALLLLPGVMAWLTIPHFNGVLAGAERTVVIVALCGAAWGVAQVLFGLALDRIGIALTFSIVLGLSAAMGSLIPLIRLHVNDLTTRAGVVSMVGIALVLAGVTFSAMAGRARDRHRHQDAAKSKHFGLGLAMAIIAGICASMMNVGFAYGSPLAGAAVAQHTRFLWVSDAIWMPLLAGGAVPNILYCLYLLRRNRSLKNYGGDAARNTSLALVMAVLWFGSSIVYGVATLLIGTLGPVVGWPLFMSLIVIVASLLGMWTGEWKQAGARALRMQGVAVLVLICAVIVLSRATF